MANSKGFKLRLSLGYAAKFVVSALIAVAATLGEACACTSFIISGRITPDGRPLIMKNRDSSNFDNLSVVVQGERYKYLAIVGASDTKPENAWAGHNEKGFAIINTAAYNLNGRDEEDSDNDGIVMRRALEICATLADFENLLDTLPRPMGVDSNFGVIDANGGCAYYETGNAGYTKFDANDPVAAPYGYLVRTNHAQSGDRTLDKGQERYLAISDFMLRALFEGNINKDYLLHSAPRHLIHGLTRVNLREEMPADASDSHIVSFKDFIPRWQTTSCVLIQGVKSGEAPELTVSWTMVGSPLTTVAVPLLITPDNNLPRTVTRANDGRSWLNTVSLKLKEDLFPLKSGNRGDYIELGKLINRSGSGVMQQVMIIEQELTDRGNRLMEQLRSRGKLDSKSVANYYMWVDDYITERYKSQFNI